MVIQDKQQKKRRTAADTRKVAESQIRKLTTRGSEEDKKRAAKIQAALENRDDELIGTDLDEQLDAMDVDEDGANDGTEGDGEAKNSDQQALNTAANAAEEGQGKTNEQQANSGENVKTGEQRAAAAAQAGQSSNDGKATGDASNPQVIPKEEPQDDDSPLFVSEAGPDVKINVLEDPEHGLPLFHRPVPKHGDDVATVGWASGISTRYINMYGKKSAARYRLEGSASSAEYEAKQPSSEQVNNHHNRYGDRRHLDNKFEFTKRHILAIFGVAWEGAGTDEFEDDLDYIDPDLHKGPGNKWPTTYVLIAWKVGDETKKSWEPRQTLRARWGKKDADKAIFDAACEAESRYSGAKTGERNATSRSPSVGLVGETTQRFRQQSPFVSKSPRSHGSQSPTPASMSSKLLEEFRTDYLECAGVSSFNNLSSRDKAEFVKAWQHAKAEYYKG
jgi:hypothetical protein